MHRHKARHHGVHESNFWNGPFQSYLAKIKILQHNSIAERAVSYLTVCTGGGGDF
jgi:hypothetical protein